MTREAMKGPAPDDLHALIEFVSALARLDHGDTFSTCIVEIEDRPGEFALLFEVGEAVAVMTGAFARLAADRLQAGIEQAPPMLADVLPDLIMAMRVSADLLDRGPPFDQGSRVSAEWGNA